jgi:uncharacterized delta-60 repeat protein
VIAVLACLPAVAAAAAGDLDPGFGSAGVTSLASGTELDGVAIQADGRPVAVGALGSSLLLARFSTSGKLQGTSTAGQGVGRAVAIQSDGKIVVAGNDSAGMVVKRFNPDGSPDAGFGSGGTVRAVPGGQANAVAVGPGGTIVAAGQVTSSDSFQRVALLRLTSRGTLDSSFGSGGVDVVNLDQDSVAKGVAVQQDGKIIFSGSVGPGAHQVVNAFVVRLMPGGSLDPSFGTGPGGIFFFFHPFGGANSTLNAVTLDPAGGIVAAGGDSENLPTSLFIRLTCAGTPAGGFGTGGIATVPSGRNTNIGNPLGAAGVAVAAGEHVVGAGRYQDSGLPAVGLTGLNANGSQAFLTRQPANFEEARSLALDPAGNLVVAGNVLAIGSDPPVAVSAFVARYAGFGTPPTSSASRCGGPLPPPRMAPVITHVSQSHGTWRASGAPGRGRPPIGTSFSYTLDQGAIVSFVFAQQVGGRKVNGRCVAQTKQNKRKPACTRTVSRGKASVTGKAGSNKLSFSGRISRSNKLSPGRYSVTITATNSIGQVSKPHTLNFTIVK